MASSRIPCYEQIMFCRTGGFGSGSDPGQFDHPWGVAICPLTNNIVVTDSNNDRVQVFNERMKYLFHFGDNWDQPLFHPMGVGVNSKGDIYVADHGNNCVKVANQSGQLLKTIGSKGSGDREYDHPTGLAIGKDDNVYVSDWGNYRVKVLKANGDELDSTKVVEPPIFIAACKEGSFAFGTQDKIYHYKSSASHLSNDNSYEEYYYRGLCFDACGKIIALKVDDDDDVNICQLDADLSQDENVILYAKNRNDGNIKPEGLAVTQDGDIILCDSGCDHLLLYRVPKRVAEDSDSKGDSDSNSDKTNDNDSD